MTHFAIAVIVEASEDIEDAVYKQIEGYDENIDMDAYVDKNIEALTTEWLDFKKEFEDWKVGKKYNRYYGENKSQIEDVIDSRIAFSQWYHKGSVFNEDGELLTTYNPDSKWDWYEIGGRWKNLLLGKDGERYDYLPIKDIDLEKMVNEDKKNRISIYDKTVEMLKKEKNNRDITLMFVAKPHIDEDTEKVTESFEDYYQRVEAGGRWFLHDLVIDHKWYSRGRHGWWGSFSEDMSVAEYVDQFWKLLEGKDDHLLVVVDCHI